MEGVAVVGKDPNTNLVNINNELKHSSSEQQFKKVIQLSAYLRGNVKSFHGIDDPEEGPFAKVWGIGRQMGRCTCSLSWSPLQNTGVIIPNEAL